MSGFGSVDSDGNLVEQVSPSNKFSGSLIRGNVTNYAQLEDEGDGKDPSSKSSEGRSSVPMTVLSPSASQKAADSSPRAGETDSLTPRLTVSPSQAALATLMEPDDSPFETPTAADARGRTITWDEKSVTTGGPKITNFRELMRQAVLNAGEGAAFDRLVGVLKVANLRDTQFLIIQTALILGAALLAVLCMDAAWDGETFRSSEEADIGTMQMTITIISIASIINMYIAGRVQVRLLNPTASVLFYFPEPLMAFLEFVIYCLHAPITVHPIFNVLVLLRCVFLFRLLKLHPGVVSVRTSQIATATPPSFSSLFYLKTLVRTHTAFAMLYIAVVCIVPIMFAYLNTERYAFQTDDSRSTDLADTTWDLVYFVIAAEPPEPATESRIIALIAAIVSIALSTMIFTGLLSSLELDSGQSAVLAIAMERNLRKRKRLAAVVVIQTFFRAYRHNKMVKKADTVSKTDEQSKKIAKKTESTKKDRKKAAQRFRAIAEELQEIINSRAKAPPDVPTVMAELNAKVIEQGETLRQLFRLVEGKTKTLYELDQSNQAYLTKELLTQSRALRKMHESHMASIEATQLRMVAHADKQHAIMQTRFQDTQDVLQKMDANSTQQINNVTQRVIHCEEQHATTLLALNAIVQRLTDNESAVNSLVKLHEQSEISNARRFEGLEAKHTAFHDAFVASVQQHQTKFEDVQAKQAALHDALLASIQQSQTTFEALQAKQTASHDALLASVQQTKSALFAHTDIQHQACQSQHQASQSTLNVLQQMIQAQARGKPIEIKSPVVKPPPAPAPVVPVESPTALSAADMEALEAVTYIPVEEREYPQYVLDLAASASLMKRKPLFTPQALYDLFPCLDRDGSGTVSSAEVRRMTFDTRIHRYYVKKEQKPWPSDQINQLQASISSLFPSASTQITQKEWVVALAKAVV